jgi:hypothetical protein
VITKSSEKVKEQGECKTVNEINEVGEHGRGRRVGCPPGASGSFYIIGKQEEPPEIIGSSEK